MNIEELTIKQIREIQSLVVGSPVASKIMPTVGQTVYIRTVTMHFAGKVTAVSASDVQLYPAVWVADSGRFGASLATGALDECEPYARPVVVNMDAATDWTEWEHDVPKEAK